MKTAEIKRRFLAHFEAQRAHRGAERAAARHRRPEPAVRQRRHGAVRAVLPGPADAAVPARGQRAEVHPHPGHRRGRQDQPARHVLPDERQLLLRRLLQGRRDPARLGAGHQAASPRAATGWTRSAIWATVYLDDDEAVRHLADRIGLPAERIVRRGKADNFWSMGIPGPVRPVLGDLLDRGPEYGPRGRSRRSTRTATWSSGTSSSCSTSGVRARARRTSRSSVTCRRRTSTPAWAWSGWRRSCRASTTCTRSTRSGRSWHRAAELTGKRYGAHSGARGERVAPRRRAAAGDRRPRAHRADADRRRRDPVQRGPRLRAAPDHAPGDPGDAAARLAGAGAARAAAGGPGLHGAVVPGGGDRLRADLAVRLRGGGGVPVHAARGHHDPRHRDRARPERRAAPALVRRQGVPAARHVRLPDRPDPGDRRRAGPHGRRRGLPPADGRAADPGEGRRAGPQDRPRRPVGVPVGAGRGRRRSTFTGYSEVARESTVRALLGADGPRHGGGRGRHRSSWCSTPPRSTPRAAASSPTRA